MKHSLLLLICVMGLSPGCGETGPKLVSVTGQVTWNQTPLAEGAISFEPLDASQVPAGGKIINGSYAVRASVGKHRVRILATRPGSTVNSQMGAAPREQYIPAMYNSQSAIEVEVTPAGPNKFDYPLVDQPAK